MSELQTQCWICPKCFDDHAREGECTPETTAAEEIKSIRNQLWQLTDEMPMTRNQARIIEIVKDRLWRVQEKLRGKKP